MFKVLLMLLGASQAAPLEDYVDEPEPAYGWFDTGVEFKTLLGGNARMLNVTSL